MVKQDLRIPPKLKHISKAKEIHLCSSGAATQLKFSPSKSNLKQGNHRRRRLSSSSTCESVILVFSNEDLLTEILLRLPPKSLLRFHCVSKQWLSIISHPYFRLLHSQRYPTNSSSPVATGLFLSTADHKFVNFISFREDEVKSMGIIASRFNTFRNSLPSGFDNVVDIHSCNGLHCILFGDRQIFVYNPTTNQYRHIPTPPGSKPWKLQKSHKALNVVFDPLVSQYYKLVRVWSRLTDLRTTQYGFSIYSSETGVWKDTSEIIEDENLYASFRRGVLYSGELHWVNKEYSFSFDMNKELLNSTRYPFPATASGHENCIRYFAECGGYLLAMKFNEGEKKLNVLQFEKDHSRWTMKYDVDFAPLYTLYAPIGSGFWNDFQILYLSVEKEEKEKKGKLVILLRDRVISYDISDMIVKDILEVERRDYNLKEYENEICYGWMHAYQHVETLSRI